MRRLLVGALLLASAPVVATAQGAGSASTIVLRLSPSPRALALGAAMAAVADAFAVEFNPAALAIGPAGGRARAGASYQDLPVDVAAGAAVLGFAAPGGAAALSVRFVDYGDVEVVEPTPGLPIGTPTGAIATGGEVTALAGYAFAVGPVRLGVAGRWLRVDVAGLTDDAFAADVGALVAPREWLAIGAAVQNLGPDVEAGRAAPLPTTFRAGARVSRGLGPLDGMLALEGRRREERNGLGVGLEIGAGAPSLRAEARVGYESRGAAGDAYSRLVFGAGIRADRLGLDFAYRALGPLGSTRQFGLSFIF
ncbi:MAG TPA: hypothetical protein VMM12_06970 [Longimicrobiales bacterium]|nr:hypothetical protein [Longimicrobiales bacterium]